MRVFLKSAAIFAACSLTFVAHATFVRTWSSSMDGSQEVPPNSSPAFAAAVGTFVDSTRSLTVDGMFAMDLLGTLTGSHIHRGAFGQSGGIMIDFAQSGSWSGNQSFYEYTQTQPIIVPAGEVSGLLAGNTYINIHSTVFGGGEVRGQILLTGWIAVPDRYTVTRGMLVGDGAIGRLAMDDDLYITVQQRFQFSPAFPNAELVAEFDGLPNTGLTGGYVLVVVKANSLPFDNPSCKQQIAARNMSTGVFEVIDEQKPTSAENQILIPLDGAQINRFVSTTGSMAVAVRVFQASPLSPAWTMNIDLIETSGNAF